ncbi:hypothetical protein Ddc_14572 [Ditylenchus destructor]|nr:hypothetical protein Ddc_14572 [Ditylenchus destructor]
MNFTLLVVALVLTQATAVEAGCTVKKAEGENRLRCMNGNTVYGYLTYSSTQGGKRYKEYRMSTTPYTYIEITFLQAFPRYPPTKVTLAALLQYFIDYFAKADGAQQIVLYRGHDLAESLLEEFNFKWDGKNMVRDL